MTKTELLEATDNLLKGLKADQTQNPEHQFTYELLLKIVYHIKRWITELETSENTINDSQRNVKCQRELLLDFGNQLRNEIESEKTWCIDVEDLVDTYLKSNNCT